MSRECRHENSKAAWEEADRQPELPDWAADLSFMPAAQLLVTSGAPDPETMTESDTGNRLEVRIIFSHFADH